jgi:prolyl oligopeptidase
MRAEQRFAVSKDGTRVPYFLVLPKGAKAGDALPTMLYGYGGFRIPQAPFYSGSWGMNWLERGGAVVIANIRGGGEYGPSWHQAALKANRQKSFDDFIAIGEHLVSTGVTKPQHLGIYGGSNGGLLTGAVAMQRPELFGAVISAVPLLDMKRYHKMLAGASWMAEYGDPDKAEEWAFISKYSPYHNIKAKADGGKYPRILFTTSTRDDRVHPAHARKMVARLAELGHEVLYYENIEGGHGGAADLAQRADLTGIQFAYLWAQLSTR